VLKTYSFAFVHIDCRPPSSVRARFSTVNGIDFEQDLFRRLFLMGRDMMRCTRYQVVQPPRENIYMHDKIRCFRCMSWIMEMTASRLESGVAHGLMLSMTSVCNSPISGTKCLRLGHNDESVRTTIAPRELRMSFSIKQKIQRNDDILTIERTSKCIGSHSANISLRCANKPGSSQYTALLFQEQNW
jgi:hypothetical protein